MTNLCPACSAAIPADSPLGMCPQCMLADGVGESEVRTKSSGDGSDAPPTAEEIQPLFPHLQIVRMIGQGGMGAVYEAKQRGLGRTVALKLLWAPKRFDAAFEQRFAREGQALAQLSHDNIVTVHDAGKSGPYYWLVMEYVDGANLRELLERGRLSPAQALPMVTHICSALEYAHQQGIVHRDIKPENILIGVDGRLKVADFGLAKMLASDRVEPKLTQSFLQLGTPHYMAPEQLETPKDVDHRADIYSLGVVLYELLTGELPLGKFELPSRVVDVDPRFDGVVSKAMQKSPSRRYQAISDVQRAVQGIVESKGVARNFRPTSSSRSAAQWPVQIALTVLVAIGGVFLWRNFQSSRGATEASVSLDALFNAGRREVATPETLHAGVKKLEQVFDRDPEHEGVRDALRDAYQALAQQERRYSRHIEAASLLRKASEVSRSPLPPNLVEAVEREASEELRGLFHFVEPDVSKPLGAKQVELVGSVDEKVHGEITIAGALVIPNAGRIRHLIGGLREGRNPIEVRLKRPGGLQVAFTIYVTVDTTEPTLELVSPKAGSIARLPVTLSGRVKDGSAVRVTCLGHSATPDADGEWSLVLDGLDEGPVELEVTAIDAGGLRMTERRSIEVDSTPPAVGIKGSPAMLATRSAFLTVPLQASDTNLKSAMIGSLEIRIESDGSFQVNVAAGDADGESRTTIVTVGDSAGNTTPFELVVTRDTSKPRATLKTNVSDLFPGSRFIVQALVEDRSPCICKFEGRSYPVHNGVFESPPAYVPDNWNPGETHSVEVEVRDAAGNYDTFKLSIPVHKQCDNCSPIRGVWGRCPKCRGEGKRITPQCGAESCRVNPSGAGLVVCEECQTKLADAKDCLICGGDGLCKKCSGTGHSDQSLIAQKRRELKPRSDRRDVVTRDESTSPIQTALNWLALHQSDNGLWESAGFDVKCGQIGGSTCSDRGESVNTVGVTGLALLAFVKSGSSLLDGPRMSVVRNAVDALLREQKALTGSIPSRNNGLTFMYNHAIATLALSSVLQRSPTPELHEAVKNAVRFIEDARNAHGAWRYQDRPNGENDTSVTGWMVVALKAAEKAGVPVAADSYGGALNWIDEVTDTKSGRVGYAAVGSLSVRDPKRNPHFVETRGETLTAIGLSCRFLLGQEPNQASIMQLHAERLMTKLPTWDAVPTREAGTDFYYWYAGTQALKQVGGARWAKWRAALDAALLGSQRRDGDERGSWDASGDPWGFAGGRIYTTALGALCLIEAQSPDGASLAIRDDLRRANAAETAGPVISAQLLKNPSCEEPGSARNIPGWVNGAGDWWPNPDVHQEGSFMFHSGVNPYGELFQIVDLEKYLQGIRNERSQLEFECYYASFNLRDTLEAVVEIRDATTKVIYSFGTGERNAPRGWHRYSEIVPIPPTARSVAVRLLSRRNEGKSNDGWFDNLSLRVITH